MITKKNKKSIWGAIVILILITGIILINNKIREKSRTIITDYIDSLEIGNIPIEPNDTMYIKYEEVQGKINQIDINEFEYIFIYKDEEWEVEEQDMIDFLTKTGQPALITDYNKMDCYMITIPVKKQ